MDDLLWRRILGSEGDVWLAVALLIGLLAIAGWQPQRISRPGRFRLAYFVLAVAIILPAVAELVVRVMIVDPRDSRQSRAAIEPAFIVSAVANLIGKLLFAVAIVCALGSLQLKQGGSADTAAPSD